MGEYKIGDRVVYLDSKGGGEIIDIRDDGSIIVMDDDFNMEFSKKKEQLSKVEKDMTFVSIDGTKVHSSKNQTAKKRKELLEHRIDLHAQIICPHYKSMIPGDVREMQMREFRRFIREHRYKKGHKLIVIHGKGDGILRECIHSELKKNYSAFSVSDADFSVYGMYGATEIIVN